VRTNIRLICRQSLYEEDTRHLLYGWGKPQRFSAPREGWAVCSGIRVSFITVWANLLIKLLQSQTFEDIQSVVCTSGSSV